MLIALGLALATFTVTLAVGRVGRRDGALRRCPLCRADAVAASELKSIDGIQVQVRLQCGQCGAWRRLVTTHWAARHLERRLEADRRVLTGWASRLQGERDASDIDALARDVVGAADFLALTRRDD